MMKVFRLNDCDWVAAKSLKEAKEWYMNETGVSEDECDKDLECSLEQTMSIMWGQLPEEEKHNVQEIYSVGGEEFVIRSFSWVLEKLNASATEPFLMASTEY